MSTRETAADFLAMVAIFVGGVLPDESAFARPLVFLGGAYITLGLVLRARTGYLRRRPYWTRDSWRRYLLVCSIPLGALLILAGMMAALEMRLPIAGAPRSSARGVWIWGILLCMLIGAGGLAIAIGWLADGEPARQFPWRSEGDATMRRTGASE